jgi:hypothetical protein
LKNKDNKNKKKYNKKIMYDEIYERIYINKDNNEEIERIIEGIKTEIEYNIDYRMRMKRVLKFLDEDYGYNRIFYYIIKRNIYNLNFGIIPKIRLIYDISKIDVERMINEIKTIDDENNFKNFRMKKMTEKQKMIIEYLEEMKEK